MAAKTDSLHLPLIFAALTTVVLVWGAHAHLERYITPQRGLGYKLGIIGASMMLALLLYSARKRLPGLQMLGSVPAWFQAHMVLGVLGPVLVLFHANFSLGATNSNVALFSMLLVAGSGIVGRYFYVRLHAQLNDREQTLEELQGAADKLRSHHSSVTLIPDLITRIERAEKKLLNPERGLFRGLLYLMTIGVRARIFCWALHRIIRRSLRNAPDAESPHISKHLKRLGEVTMRYVDTRLAAGRRVLEFRLYTQLFSFWHLLHLPLFITLIIAATVHVIAVSIY
jgi:hypothetical protein